MIRTLIPFFTLTALCACLAGSAQADTREVVVYPGFGAGQFLLEGRVIEARGGGPDAADDSWFVNLRRTLRRLINDEQKQVALRVRVGSGEWRAKTDAEGYFLLEEKLPPGSGAGWQAVEVATESGDARAPGALLAWCRRQTGWESSPILTTPYWYRMSRTSRGWCARRCS